ncbi:MAG: diguanylate cyclase [Pseudomonadota bacterium]
MAIVLVESSRVGRRMVSDMLAERGHRVVAFPCADEAFAYIMGDPQISIVITSIETSSRSGLELCWDLRSLASNGRIFYTIVMSSTFDERRLTEALDCGADDFVRKPPSKNELFARIRSAERHVASQRTLVKLAQTDPLTGLLNRRSFLERAKNRIDQNPDAPRTMFALDIDHFKAINDTYGHDVGDQAICAVAGVLSARTNCLAGRMGGEEFSLFSLENDRQKSAMIGESVRLAVERQRIPVDGNIFSMTCSVGVHCARPEEDFSDMLKEADRALYEAKESGRNRVILTGPTGHVMASGEPDPDDTDRKSAA